PTGWLIDRVGRRPIMIAGPIITSIGALLIFFTNPTPHLVEFPGFGGAPLLTLSLPAAPFAQLLVLRFFDGWAAQMWLLGRLAGISHRAAAGQRGRQVTWMYGMDNIGKLSGPTLGGFIAAAWGASSPFLAYSILAMLALIPTVLLTKEVPSQRSAAASAAPAPAPMSIKEIVMPRLPYFGIAFFAAMARGPIFGDLLHLYAAFTYGLSPQAIGLMATGASVLSLPISFTAGYILDHFGRKATMVPGFSGVAVSMMLLGLTAFFHAPLGFYIAAFYAGIATQSLTGGSVQTVGADVAPPNARGMFLGMWRFTSQIGTIISPLVFAFLADRVGYGYSFLYTSIVALIVAVLLTT